MDRRSFFKLAAPATAGLLWDPELLLWRPPKTFVFHVEPELYLPLSCEIIAREPLKVLNKNLVFARAVNRRYLDQWKGSPGAFLEVRKPESYYMPVRVREG